MSSQFTCQSSDGVTLKGWVFDPPANPKALIALVHGFGEHSGRYHPMAEHLKTHRIAMTALDLRGHGYSDGPRGYCQNYEHLKDDVAHLIKHSQAQFPDIPLFLMGHSMGGGLVLSYGLSRPTLPIKAFIAQAPLIGLARPPTKIQKWLVQSLAALMPNGAISNPVNPAHISTLQSEQAAYKADPLNHGRLGFRLAVSMVEQGAGVLEQASHWNHPLLLMHARQDKLTSFTASEQFAHQAQNCTFIAFDSVEHEIHNDTSRAALYSYLIDFINAHL